MQILSEQFLPKEIGQKIWLCNIKPSDVGKIMTPSFWRDVLFAWAKTHWHSPEDCTKAAAQVLWYNSHIRIKSQTNFLPNAFKAGILLLSDIWNFPQGSFLTFQQIQYIYGNNAISFLEYYALITAIPLSWTNLLKATRFVMEAFLFPYENYVGKRSSQTYNHLISDQLVLRKTVDKWSGKLGVQLDYSSFLNNFDNLYILTKNTKLCNFQFRFLHRAIFSADTLFRWKLVESPLCYFCVNRENETLEHLFYHCPHVQEFWSKFSSWYECLTDTEIELSEQHIYFCNYMDNDFLNMLLLIAKYFIFSRRIAEKCLDIYIYKDYVYQIAKIERWEALRTNRFKPFIKRWKLLFPAQF